MSTLDPITVNNPREQRARQLIAARTIRPIENGNGWIVPSQTSSGRYTVQLFGQIQRLPKKSADSAPF